MKLLKNFLPIIIRGHLFEYHWNVNQTIKKENEKYYKAISDAICSMKKQGRPAKVLDIGTGTGILSIMASSLGADTVVACEVFRPVAKCAESIIAESGYADKIKLINKRSTELLVGKGKDLEERANILVAEVFDTELIGEGALPTFHHALENLMEPHSLVVPSEATIYIQIVNSDLVSKWNKIKSLEIDSDTVIIAPEDIASCSGHAAIHDLQMSQLPAESFTSLMTPMEIFKFDFTGNIPLQMNETAVKETEITNSGKCDGVFMWWVLKMDAQGKIILNNGPSWIQSFIHKPSWRDHWMQGIYYLPNAIHVSKDDKLTIFGHHDEYCLWFSVSSSSRKISSDEMNNEVKRPMCTCLAHVSDSRSRIAMKNDAKRMKIYTEMLKKVVSDSTVCLCLGDGSLLPLVAAKLGAKKVFTIELDKSHQKIIQSYIDVNGFQDVIKVLKKEPEELRLDDLDNKIDVLISEPYFANCSHPWDFMRLLYLRTVLSPVLNSPVVIPEKGILRGVVVEFEDLWKIRAPVENVYTFNLRKFDQLVQSAIHESDAVVEPHQLWEYPSVARSQPFDVLNFNFSNETKDDCIKVSNSEKVYGYEKCNGVVLWVDYIFEGELIPSGPLAPIEVDSAIKWPMNQQQGVYFLSKPVLDTHKLFAELKYFVSIDLKHGDMSFKFDIE